MNKFYKEYEMLSAYIDGELSNEEIKFIEEKLAVSKDLQMKLAELKRIKELSQNSFLKLEQSEYFETKLIAEINSGKTASFKVRKWFPVLGFSLAAIVLMLFLRSNPNFFDSIIEEQKSKLAGLYTENLKPLFITAGLTNEDIFNFALHRELPLDKEKGQYLYLGTNENGSDYFEIKTASRSNTKDDFQKFIAALELNENQKDQIDSILESYADDMEAQVLVNENNTVAISPKLWNYNKAIFADVMAFAKECSGDQIAKIVPAGFQYIDKPKLFEIAQVVKAASDSDYIFMTPDTIFIESFKFDAKKFKDEMKTMRVELKKNLKGVEERLQQQNFILNIDKNIVKLKTKGSKDSKFEFYIDTNTCRVEIPDFDFSWSEVELPDLGQLELQIEEATKNIQSLTVEIPKAETLRKKIQVQVDAGKKKNKFKYEVVEPNIQVPVIPDIFINDSLLSENESFRMKIDSLAKSFKIKVGDSMIYNQDEFLHQMMDFQSEMQKLREQMMKLQKDLQKDQKKGESKKAIEI